MYVHNKLPMLSTVFGRCTTAASPPCPRPPARPRLGQPQAHGPSQGPSTQDVQRVAPRLLLIRLLGRHRRKSPRPVGSSIHQVRSLFPRFRPIPPRLQRPDTRPTRLRALGVGARRRGGVHRRVLWTKELAVSKHSKDASFSERLRINHPRVGRQDPGHGRAVGA